MYRDVRRIRKHEIKLRLDDREYALLNAFADFTGGQLAVISREMLLEQARSTLGGQSGRSGSGVEVAFAGR